MRTPQQITNVSEFSEVLNEFLKPFESSPNYGAKKGEITSLVTAAQDHAEAILEVVPDVPVRNAAIASLLANTYTLVGVVVGSWYRQGSAA